MTKIKMSDIVKKLDLTLRTNSDKERTVGGCYISDLLSDVMAHSASGDVWVTLQTHPNIIAVAVIKGLSGIVITNSRVPEEETLKKAEAEKVLVMTTPKTTFETAGLLYALLHENK